MDLDGLRSILFSSAKKRWVWGLFLGYSAIFAVPAFAFLQFSRWAGAIAAFVLSIGGLLCRVWSDSVRGDADTLHRAHELSLGIGYPISPTTISDFRHKYSRFTVSAHRRQEEQDYYEAKGKPSPDLLVAMLRESAWWTSKLAMTMQKLVFVLAVVGLAAPIFVLLSDLDQIVRAYGALACTVMLIDLFYLAWRYGRLHSTVDLSFNVFDRVGQATITERDAMILATDYQMARMSAPLLPDLLWKWQRRRLQDAWALALGKRP